MAAWPGTLPNPQSEGYTVSPQDQTVRTQMEVGADRTRRRTSARNDHVGVSWQMSDTQIAAFRTWFDNPAENAGGASWFTVNLALGNGGISTVNAKFIGPFKTAHLGGLQWSVTADLEIR